MLRKLSILPRSSRSANGENVLPRRIRQPITYHGLFTASFAAGTMMAVGHAQPIEEPKMPSESAMHGTITSQWMRLNEEAPASLEAGKAAIRAKKLAVVLLAGGHGSRLGSSEPKGCFPISPVRGASLFQLFAERLAALEELYQTRIPIIIWVSHDNAEATREFWTTHGMWGLDPEFVVQPDLPLLDDQHHPLVDAQGALVEAPNGNGSLWQTLARQGVLRRWQALGVEVISVVPIDNALAPSADPAHAGLVITKQCDVLLLTTLRRTPTEAVGVVLHDEGRIAEYSELPSNARSEQGWCCYPEGFLGITYWSIQKALEAAQLELPIHLARKTVRVDGLHQQAWKQEYFIFDALSAQSRCATRCLDRRLVFAPLKSAEGEYGVAATQAALVQAAQLRAQLCRCSRSADVKELHAELWLTDCADWNIREDGWAEASSCPLPRSR
jgi:UDP-N-acetylglucosamine pyrophosphorylase